MTQPFSTKPEPLAPQHLSSNEITNLSPEARDSALLKFKDYRNGVSFTPPSPKGSIVLSGTRRAGRWGHPRNFMLDREG